MVKEHNHKPLFENYVATKGRPRSFQLFVALLVASMFSTLAATAVLVYRSNLQKLPANKRSGVDQQQAGNSITTSYHK